VVNLVKVGLLFPGSLAITNPFKEKKMFGGVGYMLRGNLVCGVIDRDLIVRVGPDGHAAAMKKPNTRPFDMTGKIMNGWVVVTPKGTKSAPGLKAWIMRGVEFARSLPAK